MWMTLNKLLEMLQNVDDFEQIDTILIESDNCFNQYKYALHFHNLQSIPNKFNKSLICVYGVTGHRWWSSQGHHPSTGGCM